MTIKPIPVDYRHTQFETEANAPIPVAAFAESSLTDRLPINEFDALLRCAPGEEPSETLTERQQLREAIADAMDELDERDRFILEAVHAERLSLDELAWRLHMSKSNVRRLRMKAEQTLRSHLLRQPLVRERLRMATPPVIAPTNWNEAAREAVLSLTPSGIVKDAECDVLIERSIQRVRELILLGRTTDTDLAPCIVNIGDAAAELLANRGAWDVDATVDLLCRKQHDYGHSNILAFRTVGLAVRTSDKVARYFNLKDRGSEGLTEPLNDAIIDMVGYAVIAAMLENGTFELELADYESQAEAA